MNPNLKKDLSLVGLLRLIEICCSFEEELDKLRVKLIQSPSFDFVSSYLAITVAYGEINMINFISFMKSHDKHILPLEIEYFFRRVDLNSDGIIDLKEWYNFLCPLAHFWIADKNSYTPFSDDIPYLVAKDEKLIFHICKRFIDYQLVLDTPRRQLLNDPDFVVKELFDKLDIQNKSFFTLDDLSEVINSKIKPNPLLLLRILDKNKDGKVQYIEFMDFLLPNCDSDHSDRYLSNIRIYEKEISLDEISKNNQSFFEVDDNFISNSSSRNHLHISNYKESYTTDKFTPTFVYTDFYSIPKKPKPTKVPDCFPDMIKTNRFCRYFPSYY
ncbi:EF hand family protein [Cryptosporidium muris RN66]|uniref:EF hand family protein n=1 Tax=Cryptosporidium muris (strain RN66) TaxID=441375 RepID=B6AHX1_CRYMR|nr:EF hand family protein [Cryptosporidium muris RN66]EEA07812.1 EF hand family protein [Cryptosporidium muris RN66]|eukprot:XP_002142161.1 EF hand family protein [Cryptosporidium muris RN66]